MHLFRVAYRALFSREGSGVMHLGFRSDRPISNSGLFIVQAAVISRTEVEIWRYLSLVFCHQSSSKVKITVYLKPIS
jgi:hypothetical protein